MNVFILDPKHIYPNIDIHACLSFEKIKECALKDSCKNHIEVLNADQADVIIAPIQSSGYGPFFERLISSTIYKKNHPKIIIYCPDDNQYPSLKGLYPSTQKRWVNMEWTRAAHYLSTHIYQFEFLPNQNKFDKDILFSFVGSSRTHIIREKILRLKHHRAFIFDASPKNEIYWWEKADHSILREQYQKILERSKFCLCPRGIAPSSLRLFEAMEAACVPVIISDDIVLPDGPHWNNFVIMIPENEIESIPKTLEKLEPCATKMGFLARKAWEEYFSEFTSFNSIVEWSKDLLTKSSEQSLNLTNLTVGFNQYISITHVKSKMKWLFNTDNKTMKNLKI